VSANPLSRRAAARKPDERSRTRVPRRLAIAVLIGVGVGLYLGLAAQREPAVLFSASFPARGLITNEVAFWNPHDASAIRSPDWEVTSGSLFALNGAGWTGVPDGRAPNLTSSLATDSAVFRLRTARDDFENVSVSFELRLTRLLTTPRTPPQAYDGVHIWLRYQSPDWLYFASVSRRDGNVVIGRKLPTAGGGVYTDLVRRPDHFFPLDRWVPVRARIQSAGDAVEIELFVGGRLVARAVDAGKGGPPILHAGRVGIRGDNAEFEFRDFEVTAA